MDLIDRMLDHDDWANRQILGLCRDLTDAHLDQTFDIGHETLRATLTHMIFTVGFWTSLMHGQKPEYRDYPHDASIATLTEVYERSYPEFVSIARRAREEQRLDDTYQDHYDLPTSFGGTLIQIVQHNLEHRTESLHILKRLGISDLPEIDFLLWEHVTKGH